ncbi:hypothetical protein BsWGS_28222 [Bradybaena similaris]
MPVFLWGGSLLLINLLLAVEIVPGCRTGWFGSNCTFKCHCASRVTCLSDGQCAGGGSCELGYFGPACQYADMAYRQRSPSTPSYLIDGNNKTCNNKLADRSVSVALTSNLSLSWFRIETNTFDHLLGFTVIINAASLCKDEKRYITSSQQVDVTCGGEVALKELKLAGEIAPTVCSIYISADPPCPEGKFGLQCHQNCKCNQTSDCHPATGVCAHSCQPGRFGHDCSSNCSLHCHQQLCSSFTGACHRCISGFKGDFCDEGLAEKIKSNRSGLYLMIPSLLLMILIIVGIYLCKGKTSKPSVEHEGDSFYTVVTHATSF